MIYLIPAGLAFANATMCTILISLGNHKWIVPFVLSMLCGMIWMVHIVRAAE